MPTTVQLGLVTPVEGQSQAEVTVAGNIADIDAFVMLSVKDRTLLTPPGSPADGDRYLMPATGTLLGLWSTFSNNRIVSYRNGWQQFAAPKEGWRTWVDNEDLQLFFNGTAWTDASFCTLGDCTKVGTTNYEGWYPGMPVAGVGLSTRALVANQLYGVPWIAPTRPIGPILDRIAAKITAALGNIRLGIYADNGNMFPGAKLLDAGAGTATGTVSFTISQAIRRGQVIWWVFVSDNTPTLTAISQNSYPCLLGLDSALVNQQSFLRATFAYAALPANFPTASVTVETGAVPVLFGRWSS